MAPGRKITWHLDELVYIKENYMTKKDHEILAHINEHRIPSKQVKMSAYRALRNSRGWNRLKLDGWLEKEEEFIRTNYGFMGDMDLALFLNVLFPGRRKFDKKTVWKKRSIIMDLHRTKEQIARIKYDHKICGSYKSGQTWRTRGAVPDHSIKIWRVYDRKKRFIKIDGVYIPFSRWNYIQHFGEIPEGYQVWHKDDDVMNDNPENYELIAPDDIVTRRLIPRRAKKGKKPTYRKKNALTDNFVARKISGKNMETYQKVKNNPELLELYRLNLRLQREILKHNKRNENK